MAGTDGIVKFPWLRSKAHFLQTQFTLPDAVARPIAELSRRGYQFTDRFLRGATDSLPLQKLFTEGRIANAAETIGFPAEVLENLNRKLTFSFVVENRTFDLKEKETKAAAEPLIRPENPFKPHAIPKFVESPAARADRLIEEAKELPTAQIAALHPQELIGDLRSAWSQKDSLSFLISFIRLVRLSFYRSGKEVSILMNHHELSIIDDARQGKDTAGVFLHFKSGTAGERWIFKPPYKEGKPYLVYIPSTEGYDDSAVFKKALDGCQGFRVDQGKYLFLDLE
jgi:hypothetical protein